MKPEVVIVPCANYSEEEALTHHILRLIHPMVRQLGDMDQAVHTGDDLGKGAEGPQKAVESRDVLEGVITEENKGGLVASVKGIRVFIPAYRR